MASAATAVHAPSMIDPSRPTATRDGVGLDDLPLVHRELFDHSVRAATDLHDPRSELEAFIEALWEALARTFEWVPEPWPQGLPIPRLDGVADPGAPPPARPLGVLDPGQVRPRPPVS